MDAFESSVTVAGDTRPVSPPLAPRPFGFRVLDVRRRPGANRSFVAALVVAVVVAGCSSGDVGAAPSSSGVPVTATPPTTTSATAGELAPFADLWPDPVTLDRSWAPAPDEVDGMTRVARTDGQRFLLHTAGGEIDFLPGVNIGPTIPGHHPGELAIGAEDYRRWFPQIAGLGLRVVRVYTIQRPAFYDELAAYNTAHPDAPLYLFQGVWIPEERFLETGDLWDAGIVDEMRSEIESIVAVVHGDLELTERRGHASGTYTSDVTPWLAGWILGIELDPHTTADSDAANAGMAVPASQFVAADADASPTEMWLGAMLDYLAANLADRNLTMPLAFTNWPTTDPLDHPDEPLPQEDLVNIDASALSATDEWPGGLFASYHAYPYYPDFQRHQPSYAEFVHDGEVDPYAGYLTALRDHHDDMPILITEFGVPSSLGSAHLGPLGRDQGNHTETEAMSIDAELLGIISDLGLGGGFVFEWTDEWFKLTWNTVDFEIPSDRRPLWHNQWTNEQVFGLVAVEPGEDGAVIAIDGDLADWDEIPVISAPDSSLRIAATHDASWVYLMVDGADPGGDTTFAFRTLGEGDDDLPDSAVTVDATDVVVTIPADLADDGQAWIRTRQDPLASIYEPLYDPDVPPVAPDEWRPQQLILNRPLTVPTTGEAFPMETLAAGRLRSGITDPRHADFESHATWMRSGGNLEVRLPWMLLGVSDPSSQQVWRIDDGAITSETVPQIGVTVVTGATSTATSGYGWEPWTSLSWHERPKAGIDVFARSVAATLPGGAG